MRPIEPIGLMRLIGLIRPIRLIGLIVLLFVACSGSDPVEPDNPVEQETAICFSGNLTEEGEVTRAATRAGLEEVLTGDKTFMVWAYKNDAYSAGSYTSYQSVMPGYTVNWVANTANTTTSNTHDWEYVGQGTNQTIKYWDYGAKAYRFFGVTNWEGDLPADPADYEASKAYGAYEAYGGFGANSAYEITSSVDASTDAGITAAPYFSKLWFSTGNLATYPDKEFGKPVQLQFLKPFARVRFLFIYADDLDFGRESLHDPEFKPTSTGSGSKKIATAGIFTMTYPLKGTATAESWATSSTTGIDKFTIDYYEAPEPAVTPEDALPTTWPNTPGKWYTVMPARNQGSYTVSVGVVTDEAKTAVIPSEYMDWLPGYEYTYKFKITEGGGITLDVIQVAINGWTEEISLSHSVYNW